MTYALETKKAVDSVLPGIAVLIPALGALAVFLIGDRSERLRNVAAIASAACAFGLCAFMFQPVLTEGMVLQTRLGIFFGGFGLRADTLGLLFALVASFAWLFSTIYAYGYIQHEERRTRYHTYSLLTEAAALGVFLSSDFFSLFVFFELMGMLAYVLVVHNQSYEARSAGVKYIFMTVYGGLSLLMGTVLFYSYSGALSFTPGARSAYILTSACFIASTFMMAGFGVKAGMIPLHVWLPLAHPAAPSPASALLSGVMIKAGAFGLMRLIGTFHVGGSLHGKAFLLASEANEHGTVEHLSGWMSNLRALGWAIIVLAVVTMVGGMVMALVQTNAKRLLAYSSISQMGYILLGLGAAAFLGREGAMGLAGSLYHIMNHAMFKAVLFLGVGAVYYRVHTLDLTRMGGLWKRMPMTTFLCCVAALGIIGIPGFNGFPSKTLLHHAILEAAHVGGPWIKAAEIIFVITAGGTACYIAKLIILTFFGHYRGEEVHKNADAVVDNTQDGLAVDGESGEAMRPVHSLSGLRKIHEAAHERAKTVSEVPVVMRLGMAGLAACVIALGLMPGRVLAKVIVPALGGFGELDHEMVHHLATEHIFSAANLRGILPSLAIGLVLYLVATKYDLFRLRLPQTLGIDYYYSKAEVGFLRLCFQNSKRYRELRAKYWPLARSFAEYAYEWWLSLRARTETLRRAALSRIVTIPLDIQGFTAYILARQFTGDIAYGVSVIIAAAALLALYAVFG